MLREMTGAERAPPQPQGDVWGAAPLVVGAQVDLKRQPIRKINQPAKRSAAGGMRARYVHCVTVATCGGS
jgi:hypothetical protein